MKLIANPWKDSCVNCKHPRESHNAKTSLCPSGRAHRTLGFTQYGPTHFKLRKRAYFKSGTKPVDVAF